MTVGALRKRREYCLLGPLWLKTFDILELYAMTGGGMRKLLEMGE